LLFIAVFLPVIARNEAIQAQATTWIASIVAMTGEIQCTKISRVKYNTCKYEMKHEKSDVYVKKDEHASFISS
jgi:hypothetical protein